MRTHRTKTLLKTYSAHHESIDRRAAASEHASQLNAASLLSARLFRCSHPFPPVIGRITRSCTAERLPFRLLLGNGRSRTVKGYHTLAPQRSRNPSVYGSLHLFLWIQAVFVAPSGRCKRLELAKAAAVCPITSYESSLHYLPPSDYHLHQVLRWSDKVSLQTRCWYNYRSVSVSSGGAAVPLESRIAMHPICDEDPTEIIRGDRHSSPRNHFQEQAYHAHG